MSYATIEDVNNRFGESFLYTVADRDNDDTIDTIAVERALVDASELINTYLLARYPLPLSKPFDILKRHCISIAVYWLAVDSGGSSEYQHQQYKDAMEWLACISKGTVELEVATVDSEGANSSSDAFFEANLRQFTRDKLRSF